MLTQGLENLMSVRCTGTFGYGGGFGKIVFGYNRFGFHSDFCGIYSAKKTLKGKKISRMKFYRTPNPQTVPQQANRQKFANLMSIWHDFSPALKQIYNTKAKRYKMSGLNLYLSQNMKG